MSIKVYFKKGDLVHRRSSGTLHEVLSVITDPKLLEDPKNHKGPWYVITGQKRAFRQEALSKFYCGAGEFVSVVRASFPNFELSED